MDKEKKYNNIRYMVASIGTGALVSNTVFGIWDSVRAGFDCSTPVVIIGTLAALTTGVALLTKNPYKEVVIEEEQKEQEEVLEEKPKVKTLKK